MEKEDSNIAEYKVVPHNLYTYGIGPNVEPTIDKVKEQEFWKEFMLVLFYVWIIVFIACIHCKLDNVIIRFDHWSLLLIPFSIALVPLGVYYYLYIKGQMGYTIASFFCMKTTIFTTLILCIALQVYLIMLRVDEFIKIDYALVFMPIYLCILISLVLFFILMPLSISCQMPFVYYDAMIAVYCVSTSFSLFYLIKRLDNKSTEICTRDIFQPIWIACGINFLISLPKLKEQFWTIMFLIFSFMFTLEEFLKIDGKLNTSWWILTLTFSLAFAIPLFTF